jgi:hypothetical protein
VTNPWDRVIFIEDDAVLEMGRAIAKRYNMDTATAIVLATLDEETRQRLIPGYMPLDREEKIFLCKQ